MKSFLVQRWFLIALVAVLVVGMRYAAPLAPLASLAWLRDAIVASVMFCMALPLEARAMWRTMLRPGPPLLAIGVSFGLLPLFAWSLAGLLPLDLGTGLLVAAATPCTLASASVWTRRAGGNDAISTLVTILTNASCFLVTPLWLVVLTGKSVQVENPDLGFARMTIQLGVLVVLPIVAAQLLRRQPVLAAIATRRKIELGVLAQCGILSMVLLSAIKTGLKLLEPGYSLAPASLAWMLLLVIVVHTAMFFVGVNLAKTCGFSREEQIAVGFSGSQKTLMVGLLMAVTLKASILPMVAYHVLQLFIDTLIADGYRKRGERAEVASEGSLRG